MAERTSNFTYDDWPFVAAASVYMQGNNGRDMSKERRDKLHRIITSNTVGERALDLSVEELQEWLQEMVADGLFETK